MRNQIGALKSIVASLRNNPDYGGAVTIGYGFTMLQILLQVILVPLYLSVMGKFSFGMLMIFLSAANSSRLGLSWLSGRVLRVLGAAYAEQDRMAYARLSNGFRLFYISYGLLAGLAVTLVGMIWPEALVGDIPADQMGPLRVAIPAFGIYIVGQNWLALEGIMLAAQRRQMLTQFSLMISVVVFAALVIPTLLFGGDIGAIALCYMGSMAASLGFCLLIAFRSGWAIPAHGGLPRYSEVYSEIRPQARAYAYYGGLVLVLQSDTLIVGILGGAEAVAHFVLVWKIAEVVILLLWRFCDTLQPEIINMEMTGNRERISRVYNRGMRILLLLGVSLGIGYALFGAELVKSWVGESMAPTGMLPFAMAGGAILWLTVSRLPSVLTFSLGQLRQLNILMSIEVAARLVLTLALFPTLSFLAPLVAINLVHGLGLGLAYYVMGKRA